jgi:hypothetical protein
MIYAILLILLAGPFAAPAPPVFACDAALAALLTPRQPVAGRYEVCTTPASLDEVLADTRGPERRVGGVQALDPLDAFGTAGPYDRSALSRLYGGRRARVVHAWSQDSRGLVSITYVSPHPNASFTALEPGTLAIRYTLENRGL